MATNELPFFKFFVDPYLRGRIGLCDDATQGIFVRLLIKLWIRGGYLEDDLELLGDELGRTAEQIAGPIATLKRHECLKISNGQVYVAFILDQLVELAKNHGDHVFAGHKGGVINQMRRRSDAKAALKDGSSGALPSKEERVNTNTPITPFSGKGGTRVSKKFEKVRENTALMDRIGAWFGRPPGTLWTLYEAELLEALAPPAQEVKFLEQMYLRKRLPKGFKKRQSVARVLRHWRAEQDKAHRLREHRRFDGGMP